MVPRRGNTLSKRFRVSSQSPNKWHPQLIQKGRPKTWAYPFPNNPLKERHLQRLQRPDIRAKKKLKI